MRLPALLLLAACTTPPDAAPPTTAPAQATASTPPAPIAPAPVAPPVTPEPAAPNPPEPVAPQPTAPTPPEPVAPEPAAPDAGTQTAPRWPINLDRDLPRGCVAWSKDQQAAVCILGGGSQDTGHAFTFSFLGRDPKDYSAGEWPSVVRGLRPQLIGSARKRVARRLAAGKYEALPPAIGRVTPEKPLEADRFILRWQREKTGRAGSDSDARDVYTDTIQLACKRTPDRFHTVLRRKIENPESTSAGVYLLLPDHLLIQRHNSSRRGDDLARHHEAVLVDLRARGC